MTEEHLVTTARRGMSVVPSRGAFATACGWLEIDGKALAACADLPAFQALAHRHYRRIVQYYHPDTRHQHPHALARAPVIIESHKTALLRVQRAYARIAQMNTRQWERMRSPPPSVQDNIAVPWDLDRYAYTPQQTMPMSWFGYS